MRSSMNCTWRLSVGIPRARRKKRAGSSSRKAPTRRNATRTCTGPSSTRNSFCLCIDGIEFFMKLIQTATWLAGALTLFMPRTLPAQTAYPMLMALKPVAAQVGKTSEHEVLARYSLEGTYKVLVSGDGVTGEVVPEEEKPASPKQPEEAKKSEEKKKKKGKRAPEALKVRFTVSADALAGVRDFRLVTPRGVSTVGQLVVVRDPVIAESDKNNTAAEAQPITLPATVCGSIEALEDIDIFRFK